MIQKVIDNLKAELKNDPEGLDYAHKTPDEISELLNKPFIKNVTVSESQPARLRTVIDDVLNTYIKIPDGLGIDANGKILGDFPTVKVDVETALASEFLKPEYNGLTPDEALARAKNSQEVLVIKQVENAPRIYAIISGIAEAPNKFTTQEITENLPTEEPIEEEPIEE